MRVLDGGERLWEDRQGRLHRDGGPAIEQPDGSKAWWIHGEPLCRDPFPTAERRDTCLRQFFLGGVAR